MYVRKCKFAHQNTKASPLDSGLNEFEPRKEMLPLRRQHALVIAGEEFKYPGIFFDIRDSDIHDKHTGG